MGNAAKLQIERELMARLYEDIAELEAMLPESQGVCVWCKDEGAPPSVYVHDRVDLIAQDADSGGDVCRDCCDADDDEVPRMTAKPSARDLRRHYHLRLRPAIRRALLATAGHRTTENLEAVSLFCWIVWRPWDEGYRLSARTAWDVARGLRQ